ncbi:hypothetical protein F2Q69_00033055 [Brassica cretica]|uniref:Uncharacterized protein n=2 Tax=Brassica cretica TaxID=69181 RepID=A0A8S9SIK7_BRACR|nr:hypothetical protein DY000_02036860 [Brassica cretica]KAF3600497.1 hypothetical protein F2Q69_00033055 [Brassica cretica]
MGIVFTKLFSSVFGNKEARILVLGLDNAGKTTILYRLQMGEVVSTIPSGQTSIRPYWRCYFPNTQAVIYVVDSSDTDRIGVAKEEFHAILENVKQPCVIKLRHSRTGTAIDPDLLSSITKQLTRPWLIWTFLQEEELKGAMVLIFANKQDLPGALDDAAVTEALELHKIKSRQWAIFKTCAVKGEGLFEGLDWLSNTLKSGTG